MPNIGADEKLLAGWVAKGNRRQFDGATLKRLDIKPGMRVALPAGLNGYVAMFFIAGRTGMRVKRPAVNAEGFVLDHYDAAAIGKHLQVVGNRLMDAFGANPPYALFSDSLEVFASDWTPDMLAEFHKRRGYDLTPYLPALIGDIGEKTPGVRADRGKTQSELADERYLTPIQKWASEHGTKFRSQTYGVPPVTLSSNNPVDLPEGERPHWKLFTPTRRASWASHLYGKNVTPSETWWKAAPDISKYLQRVSWLLRQGKPANDIAIYLPTPDAYAGFTAGRNSVDRAFESMLGEHLIPQVLNAGYNYDFINDGAIRKLGVPYPLLMVPNVERMPLATIRKLRDYAANGGVVLATKRAPSIAPGLSEAGDTAEVARLSKALFDAKRVVLDETTMGARLNAAFQPDFAVASATPKNWLEDPKTKFFSGRASYVKNVELPASLFGPVWHPPFLIEITRALHPGRNNFNLIVGNTAVNGLAGSALPDYKLLTLKYGNRFQPRDMENLQPLRSGIPGKVMLISK